MPHSTEPVVDRIDVAIIGAGWYGLVAARTFLRLQPAANVLIVDDDSTVGGVWSHDRLYPNLVAQVKLGLFNYTDTPMPSEGTTDTRLVTGKMIHKYLNKYAQDHDLLRRIRFNTFIEGVERCEVGWRLHIRGKDDLIECKKLMVATGVTSIPYLPNLPMTDVTIPIIHSKDLGTSWKALESRRVQHVVVVGAAKSAYDAVYLLLSMGKRVTWIIRPDGAGPLAILPTELLGVLNSIAVASTRLMTYLSPSILNTHGALYTILQRTIAGRWLTGAFWDFTAYLSHKHAGYSSDDHVSALKPEVEGKSIFWANSGLGVVTLPDFWSRIHSGDVEIVRQNLRSIEKDLVYVDSGRAIQADHVVMCTGWGDHFAMFNDATKIEVGLPTVSKHADSQKHSQRDNAWEKYDIEADRSVNEKLPFIATAPKVRHPRSLGQQHQRNWRLYRRSIPLELAAKGDRSLAIMGQIHTVQTPLVSEMQSFWTILYLLGELDVPDSDTMSKEVAEWNAWTRKRYLSQGQKFPYSLYDFLPYVDTLCKDLGINSRRKTNPWSELFSPYKPEDFSGFIDEYLEHREREQQQQQQTATVSLEKDTAGIKDLLSAIWAMRLAAMPVCGVVIALLTIVNFMRLKWVDVAWQLTD